MQHLFRIALQGAKIIGSCAFVLCTLSNVNAQPIVNGSFEEWGEFDPIGWTTANQPTLYLPVTRSEKAIDSLFSLNIRVIDSTDHVQAPFAFVGTNDNFGFPITGKPRALEGYVSTKLVGGDFLNILAFMVRKGSLIGSGSITISTDHPEFVKFSIPLEYFGDVEPDMGRIAFVLEAPPSSIGTEVWIDGLKYVTSSSRVEADGADIMRISYTSKGIDINVSTSEVAPLDLEIIDIHGRTLQSLYSGITNLLTLQWRGNDLPDGVYFVRLRQPDRTELKKVVLSRW